MCLCKMNGERGEVVRRNWDYSKERWIDRVVSREQTFPSSKHTSQLPSAQPRAFFPSITPSPPASQFSSHLRLPSLLNSSHAKTRTGFSTFLSTQSVIYLGLQSILGCFCSTKRDREHVQRCGMHGGWPCGWKLVMHLQYIQDWTDKRIMRLISAYQQLGFTCEAF